MIGLVSAVYDDYDTLKPYVTQDVEIDAVCVTDNPALACDGWRVVVEARPGVHPNRAAKVPKCLPWNYTDAETSVWVDASFRIGAPSFVRDVSAYADPIAQFAHWDRDCIYDEAHFSEQMGKYEGEPLAFQAAAYWGRYHPPNWGLWATGIIARRHTPEIVEFGRAWLDENNRWSFQDQVSEPVALRELGLRPTTIPGTYHNNPWVMYAGSARH